LRAREELYSALSKNNIWAHDASMIVALFSKSDLDCRVMGRDYYLFDTGMATAFMILRATELGLVAHPIAGYNEEKVKEIFGIPEDMKVIILVNIGKHSDKIKDFLSEAHKKAERTRPERLPLEEIVYIDRFT